MKLSDVFNVDFELYARNKDYSKYKLPPLSQFFGLDWLRLELLPDFIFGSDRDGNVYKFDVELNYLGKATNPSGWTNRRQKSTGNSSVYACAGGDLHKFNIKTLEHEVTKDSPYECTVYTGEKLFAVDNDYYMCELDPDTLSELNKSSETFGGNFGVYDIFYHDGYIYYPANNQELMKMDTNFNYTTVDLNYNIDRLCDFLVIGDYLYFTNGDNVSKIKIDTFEVEYTDNYSFTGSVLSTLTYLNGILYWSTGGNFLKKIDPTNMELVEDIDLRDKDVADGISIVSSGSYLFACRYNKNYIWKLDPDTINTVKEVNFNDLQLNIDGLQYPVVGR